MRIQHNIPAMSSYRNYTNNASALAQNLEKLSSGYKINRAGDDAAGLAISEKMRAQITGLEVAQKNAKDGISMVQTAEGALTEVHSMLNRMYELAEQSANGTYADDVDREQLQKEVEQLRTEINRIADSSNFNGINLLDGSLEDGKNITKEFSLDFPDVGDVLGTDTVLHKEMAEQEAGSSFTVDLTDLAWKPASTSDTMLITIGNNEYTITATDYDATNKDTYTATDIINALIADGGDLKNNGYNDGSNDFTWKDANDTDGTAANFKVTASEGKLIFTQCAPPTSEENVMTVPANVSISIEGDGGSFGKIVDGETEQYETQDYNVGVTDQHAATLGDGGRLASTVIDVTPDMVKNGASLELARTTYTFTDDLKHAIGTNTTDHGFVYIGDLDLNKSDGINKALSRLTAAIQASGGGTGGTSGENVTGDANEYFSVGYDGTRLTIKEIGGKITYDAEGKTKDENGYDFRTLDGLKEAIKWRDKATSGEALTLQIGDTAESFNKLKVSINDMHADAIGIGEIDISTQTGAADAMAQIKDAINYVSDVRGTLGATQNRLDHTINNLSVMEENIQDAESTIRDVDIAAEMMNYTKNNILVQSAQAMLAQANQLPQGVLQLLQ